MFIDLQCGGDNGELPIGQNADVITFRTPANCPLTSFKFLPMDPPNVHFHQQKKNKDGSVSYGYDGSVIPKCKFEYTTAGGVLGGGGNGTGVVKN
jgi:hypothetical protein